MLSDISGHMEAYYFHDIMLLSESNVYKYPTAEQWLFCVQLGSTVKTIPILALPPTVTLAAMLANFSNYNHSGGYIITLLALYKYRVPLRKHSTLCSLIPGGTGSVILLYSTNSTSTIFGILDWLF